MFLLAVWTLILMGLQKIYWWTTDVMLHFSKSVPMKKQTSWMAKERVNCLQVFTFGWTNYSFKKRLTILDSWGALWGNVALCNHSSPYSCAPLDTIWVQHCCTSQPQPWWGQKGRVISKREEFDCETVIFAVLLHFTPQETKIGNLLQSDNCNILLQLQLFSLFCQLIVHFSGAEDDPFDFFWVFGCRTTIWNYP